MCSRGYLRKPWMHFNYKPDLFCLHILCCWHVPNDDMHHHCKYGVRPVYRWELLCRRNSGPRPVPDNSVCRWDLSNCSVHGDDYPSVHGMSRWVLLYWWDSYCYVYTGVMRRWDL